MRRRPKASSGPIDVLRPPRIPPFVDDMSLSPRERTQRVDEWIEKYFEPWQRAKSEYEEANGVLLVRAEEREFYDVKAGVIFVEGMPQMPDYPWDPDAI